MKHVYTYTYVRSIVLMYAPLNTLSNRIILSIITTYTSYIFLRLYKQTFKFSLRKCFLLSFSLCQIMLDLFSKNLHFLIIHQNGTSITLSNIFLRLWVPNVEFYLWWRELWRISKSGWCLLMIGVSARPRHWAPNYTL